MGSYDDDAPRLSEIGRMIGALSGTVNDFRSEVRTALADKVSKELYNADMSALKDRVIALETRNRSLTNTVIGIFATVVAAGVVAYLGFR